MASIDVESTKNYRITNGNQAFCYSIVWITIPVDRQDSPTVLAARTPFRYTSVYLNHDGERRELIEMAATDLAAAAETADYITGHQLCSDLAVLAANTAPDPPPALAAARRAWGDRRGDPARRYSIPGSTRATCSPVPPGGWLTCAAKSTST